MAARGPRRLLALLLATVLFAGAGSVVLAQEGELAPPPGQWEQWSYIPPSDWSRPPPRGELVHLDQWGRITEAWACVHFESYDAWGVWYENVTGVTPETQFCGYIQYFPMPAPPGVESPNGEPWQCFEAPNVLQYTVPFNRGICRFASTFGSLKVHEFDAGDAQAAQDAAGLYVARLGEKPETGDAVKSLGLELPDAEGDFASSGPSPLAWAAGTGVAVLGGGGLGAFAIRRMRRQAGTSAVNQGARGLWEKGEDVTRWASERLRQLSRKHLTGSADEAGRIVRPRQRGHMRIGGGGDPPPRADSPDPPGRIRGASEEELRAQQALAADDAAGQKAQELMQEEARRAQESEDVIRELNDQNMREAFEEEARQRAREERWRIWQRFRK